MRFRHWYNAQKVSVQVAVVGGILAILGGVITGLFGIIDIELVKPGGQTTVPAPAPTLTTSIPRPVSPSLTPPASF